MATLRPAPESARPGRLRSALLTTFLIAPAAIWYLVLLVAPLAIVVIFSFGVRAKNGGYEPALVLDNYVRAFERPDPFIASLTMASVGALLCLLVGLPLAYFLATRAGRRKSVLILLVERLKGEVVGLAFLVELDFLKGRARLDGRRVTSVIQY